MECGKPFYKPPCLARIKFCSNDCYWNNRRKWKLPEEWKKKISKGVKKNLPSTAYKKGQRPSPNTEFKKGENLGKEHPRWAGGIGSYKTIVQKNKSWKCEYCESLENLHVHHVDKNRNNNEINNLMVLCHKCHMGEHKRLRNGKIKN